MSIVTLPEGLRLNVLDEGRGPPLLLVHGFPLNQSMWRYQVEAFSDRYRVLAPDLRGFGRSDVMPGTVTMQQYADDLAALLDALEIREQVDYCGLSMGGYVAWQFALRHADRLRSLTLCNTRAIADTPEGARGRLALAEQVLREGPAPAESAMLPRLLAPDAPQRRPDLVQQVRQMIVSTPSEGLAAALRGMAQRPDVSGQLGQLRVRALCVSAAQDAIIPTAEMRSIAAAIPGCRFVEIAGAGHMAPLEAPAEFNAALAEFLGP